MAGSKMDKNAQKRSKWKLKNAQNGSSKTLKIEAQKRLKLKLKKRLKWKLKNARN
jgi:hypothetical protein